VPFLEPGKILVQFFDSSFQNDGQNFQFFYLIYSFFFTKPSSSWVFRVAKTSGKFFDPFLFLYIFVSIILVLFY